MPMLRIIAAAVLALIAAAAPAPAQDWPTRPLTLVVPFAAGGAFDVMARVFTPQLSQNLHQQVIVENMGAAAGIVGTNRVAKATPDGYTFLFGTIGTHAFNPALYKKLSYNAVTDFETVALIPELATAHEQGLTDFEAITWAGFFLPKGTPVEIVNKLHAATVEMMDAPAFAERMHELGVTLVAPERRSPEYLQKFVEREIEKWGAPIKAAGISVD